MDKNNTKHRFLQVLLADSNVMMFLQFMTEIVAATAAGRNIYG